MVYSNPYAADENPQDIFYQELLCPPKWIEQIPGCCINSCKVRRFRPVGDAVVVAKYVSVEHYRAFVKIFALEDVEHPPFSSMNYIWQEMHRWSEENKTWYRISSDGWVVSHDGMSPPTDNDIDKAVYDTITLYRRWRPFPQAPTFDILEKLHSAKSAVERMQNEEKHGNIKQNIERLRNDIKRTQDDIFKLEGSLTTIYEAAADGMNLLEKYGIEIDINKPIEEKRTK